MSDIILGTPSPHSQDLTGLKFGKLTATRFIGWKVFPCGSKRQLWEFICECGNNTRTTIDAVKSGNTTSCGCYGRQRQLESITKHGHAGNTTKTRLYSIWQSMVQRCNNPKHSAYADYGGRGIKLIWVSFPDFLKDMGPSYVDGLTIGRKNNDGNYCKDNCEWQTRTQQNRNKRDTHWITWNGETKALCEWSERTGVHAKTLTCRLKAGWSLEKTLTTPSKSLITSMK